MSAETPSPKQPPKPDQKPLAKILGELGELGKASSYVNTYTPSLLFPIERASKRLEIGIKGNPIFMGADLWTAYELSWLNSRGKPEVAIARFIIPCESTHIVESKSFKLYLKSFNSSCFESKEQVKQCLETDLTKAIWSGTSAKAQVSVQIHSPSEFHLHHPHEDIRSRITYSVNTPRLGPEDMEAFLLAQLDHCGLPHSTYTPEAMGLIVRASDGLMRRARNVALSCLLEAVRARKRTVDLDNVNRVLMQPHWREERDIDSALF